MLLIIYAFNYADRYLLAALAEPLKVDLGLNDEFIGLLMGPAFALLFGVFSIPLARLADRRSRILILSVGCIVWSLFTMASGFAESGWTLALMRVGVGIGEAAFIAPAYSLLSARFPPERRPLAFAILGVGLYAGQAGGYVVGPAIAAVSDWRMAFIVVGIAGGVVGLIALLTVAEPRRAVPPMTATGSDTTETLGQVFRYLWRQPRYVLLNLGIALGTFSGFAFGMWAPSLFVRVHQVPVQEATTVFGTAFSAAALIGMLGFGALSNRLSRRDLRMPLFIAAIATGAATLFIMLATIAPSMKAVIWLSIPCGLLGGGWSVGVISSLQMILPDKIRATGMAIFSLLTTLLGMVLGPYVVGLLSDSLGGDAAGLRTALLIVISLGFPAAACLWRAAMILDPQRIEPLAKP